MAFSGILPSSHLGFMVTSSRQGKNLAISKVRCKCRRKTNDAISSAYNAFNSSLTRLSQTMVSLFTPKESNGKVSSDKKITHPLPTDDDIKRIHDILTSEEISHYPPLGDLIKVTCENVTTKDGLMATVSYEFRAKIPDRKIGKLNIPDRELLRRVKRAAEICVRMLVMQVEASEIVLHAKFRVYSLAMIKVLIEKMGATCYEACGNNIEVSNIQAWRFTDETYFYILLHLFNIWNLGKVFRLGSELMAS